MKPVHSQSQSIWFKVLSGILGLGAALASAFFVFGIVRLGLFSQPVNILIGGTIALLMVILIAMQFSLTTSLFSKIGMSLLTLVVTLVMGAASLFFFQEADALPWSFSSSSSSAASKSSSLTSSSLSLSHGALSPLVDGPTEQVEDGFINTSEEDPAYTSSLENPNYPILNPLDPGSTNSSSSNSVNEVIVDTPLYVPDGDDSIYVDEPLYIPPESDTDSSHQDQATTNTSTSF